MSDADGCGPSPMSQMDSFEQRNNRQHLHPTSACLGDLSLGGCPVLNLCKMARRERLGVD